MKRFLITIAVLLVVTASFAGVAYIQSCQGLDKTHDGTDVALLFGDYTLCLGKYELSITNNGETEAHYTLRGFNSIQEGDSVVSKTNEEFEIVIIPGEEYKYELDKKQQYSLTTPAINDVEYNTHIVVAKK